MEESSPIFTASEFANYVVCPESWRLKRLHTPAVKHSTRGAESKRRKTEWAKKQDLSAQLRYYGKITYLLLVGVAIMVFLIDQKGAKSLFPQSPSLGEHVTIPLELYLLLILLGLIIFFWDLFDRRSKSLQQLVGIESAQTVAVKDGQYIPGKSYTSLSLGLSGKPDAIVEEEDGTLVPVCIFPMTQKVRDRHVITLLVHLRLVEEIEKKTPPYGLLIMGKKGRSTRLLYTEEKKKWLKSVHGEMRAILDGVPAEAAPAYQKCKHCDVQKHCEHSKYQQKGTEKRNEV